MSLCSTASTASAFSPRLRFGRSLSRVCAAVTFLSCVNYFDIAVAEPDATSSIRPPTAATTIQKIGGAYRVGNPYVIAGQTYVPREEPNYRAEGVASWYGDKFHGRLTANGEIYDMNALTAAHPTLPLPSYVRVTNLENYRSMILRVNDRGPFHNNRLIDLSVSAAKLLGFYDQGLAQVRVEYFGAAELEGSDDDKLVATLHRNDPHSTESSTIMPSRAIASNQIMAFRQAPSTQRERSTATKLDKTATQVSADLRGFAIFGEPVQRMTARE